MIDPTQLASLLACPACRFDSNSEMTAAANLAVGVMILVLMGVLGGFLSFMWKMFRAERALTERGAGPSAPL